MKTYEKKENDAYDNYYKLMESNFDVKHNKVSFLDKKYKNGFTDENYCKDMFKSNES